MRTQLVKRILSALTLYSSWFIVTSANAPAQDHPLQPRLVRAIPVPDAGIAGPAGLAYLPAADAFLVVESQGAARPGSAGLRIAMANMLGDALGTAVLESLPANPLNVTFNSHSGSLLFLDSAAGELVELQSGLAGGHSSAGDLARFPVGSLGLLEPRGMTFDPASGFLYFLDAAGPRVLSIAPGSASGFDVAAAMREGRVAEIGLGALERGELRGLAIDERTGLLYVLDAALEKLYGLSREGGIVSSFDLASLGLSGTQGMVFAPSGDPTDDPLNTSLYVSAGGRSGGKRAGEGQIVELSITETATAITTLSTTTSATLVRTIKTSAWSPASPDPAGLVYLPSTNRLLVTDSEVEEMQIWAGKNVWEMGINGSVLRTANTTSFTKEPTGAALNPANNHLFLSDDDQRRVFEVAPGADGLYLTSDDKVTSFDTRSFNCNDPEGLAFGEGCLYIADGVGAEVYRVCPGANGLFEGGGSGRDDQISHFDTYQFGEKDPEGIEYNPQTGTLYLVSHYTDSDIVETTTTGTLVRVIDLAAANARAPAGLALAPSSEDPSVMNLYVADRGVDNDSSSSENDGKIYEIDVGTFEPPPPPPPPPPPTGELIFADGFESGNLSAWSANKPDGVDLLVTAAAALQGSFGMAAVLDDSNSIYVTDERPASEAVYRAQFYFDPNSVVMSSGNSHYLLEASRVVSGNSTTAFRLEFRFSSGAYQLRVKARDDAGDSHSSDWSTITDAPHLVVLDWRASAAGANGGSAALWIDGLAAGSVTGVDNDTLRIDRVRLGAVSGVDSGTRGTYYFDAFESRR